MKFLIDTCSGHKDTNSPLGRAVDHPSYLINRDETTLAKYVSIINSRTKEEEKATKEKEKYFNKLRQTGASPSAETIDKLIKDEDDAKLRTEEDRADKIMSVLRDALEKQKKKLADLLGSETEFVSRLQMSELKKAIEGASETKMFCGTSLTIAAELQKRGVADKVTLFQQGVSILLLMFHCPSCELQWPMN